MPEPEEESTSSERTLRRLGAEGVSVPLWATALAFALLIGFVVVFQPLRSYLSQRAQYDEITRDLAQAQATATALEDELAQWQDDDYVRSQARQRLFYVMPGETTYVVVGGDQLDEEPGTGPAGAPDTVDVPWYEVLRRSAEAAGGVVDPEGVTDAGAAGGGTSAPEASAPATPATPGGADGPDEGAAGGQDDNPETSSE